MTATETVDEDRLVTGMTDADYRAAAGVSQTGLKLILDSPARYQWEIKNPRPRKHFDFGHVVHSLILGRGLDAHIVDAASWVGKAAQQEADEARAAGKVPILAKDYQRAIDAAAAVRDHPLAGPMLEHPGESEVAMFWTDQETGVACKALVDRLTVTADETHWLFDPKHTSRSAQPRAFARDAATYGYHVQAAFYLDGYHAITGEQCRFVNVVVEGDAPHLVSVVELDTEAIDVGRARYRDALDIYARCVETGVWPGYTETFAETISLPRWATYI